MNKRQKIVQQQFINNEEAVIKRLKQVYNQSLKDIEKKAQALQDDINRLGTLARLSVDDDEKAVLKSMEQSKIYQKQYQDALKKQVSSILDNMQVEEFKTVSEYLQKCYEDGFVGTMFDLQGQGIPLCFPLDQEAMVRAVQLDSKISQGLYSRLGEDVTVLKKKITAQVSRGISTGMSFQQVAKQLADYTNIGFNNAVRIARTEGHRIQVQSGMDACYKAKEKGADVVKQWDSTLDSSTRESHQKVDGEVRELNEKFSNGLMFPGDPSGGAAEVVNCRCALLQRARWALEGSFTKMNNFTKQLETFESPEAYEEFKKGFFSAENKKYMNYVQQMEEKYKTKDFAKVLDSMTDQEYKHYSKLLESNPMFNKKAPKASKPTFTPAKTKDEAAEYAEKFFDVDANYTKYNIDVANAVNETMYNAKQIFGEHALDELHYVGTFPKGYSTRMAGGYVKSTNPAIDGSLWLRNVGTKNAFEKLESVAKQEFEAGFWSTPEALHTIRHELGHAIHRAIGTPEKNAQINALREGIRTERFTRNRKGDRNHKYSDWLSEYGFTNTGEFVAESVAEYLAGNPRETARKVVEILTGGNMT